MIGLSLAIVLSVSPAIEESAALSKPQLPLTTRYQQRYQQFVDAFKKASETSVRLELIDSATRDLTTLLLPHVATGNIQAVFPDLESTVLVDISAVLIEVLQKHPDEVTRADALLSLSRHYGNNRQRELCWETLSFLDEKYGSLKAGDYTFSQEAKRVRYFFETLATGCDAPPTLGEDADGTVFRLSDYKGKVVLLRFWGYWCPACRAMFDYERELVTRYRNRPFALVGVNSDPKSRLKTAQSDRNLTWRSFWDGGTTRGPISTIYQIEQWPTIVIIDAEGVIQYRSRGFTEKQIDAILTRLVGEAEAKTVAKADASAGKQ